jgi:hypothetical protein
MSDKIIRIGGASGFWGDSAVAAPQLVERAEIDYLVFDYLAEVTMSILSNMRARDPAMGYAHDFVSIAMKSVLRRVAATGIRVLSNAGGVNPRACAEALAALARELGVDLKIAVVEGDDLMPQIDGLRGGVREMTSGRPLPDTLMSANAYLGALPIARALDAGAQIVITGRCVDSALALGALIHEFGWQPDDYDKLAAGSLIGHILECGCQATGGLHTDWEKVERWEDIGYPIAECRADGGFTVTKPPGTGGLVVPAVIAEQMLYEIGDPSAYILPDVVCDFTRVTMREAGPDRVFVTGARGAPPTDTYKVSATYADGFRCIAVLTIIGIDAARKARRTADAILARTRDMFRAMNIGDFRATDIEVLGAETIYGPHARAGKTREAVMKLAVQHENKKALEIFAREIAPAGTSWSPGTTGISAGRPQVQPVIRLFSFMLPKSEIAVTITLDGKTTALPMPAEPRPRAPRDAAVPVPAQAPSGTLATVPLVAIAWGRSGDKGDTSNIGIIARMPEFLPLIRHTLTPEAVKRYFAHLVKGAVERFDVPGIDAVNFLLHQALGGGGMASLRNDPLGKGMAQMLLDLPVQVPAAWIERYGLKPVEPTNGD